MNRRQRRDRKLSPGRRARLDQVLAAARSQSVRGNAFVTVVADIDGTRGCSWCDCPILDHAGGITPATCTGCPRPADLAVYHYHPGGVYRGNTPVCDHHLDDLAEVHQQIGGTPTEVVVYDPRPWKADR